MAADGSKYPVSGPCISGVYIAKKLLRGSLSPVSFCYLLDVDTEFFVKMMSWDPLEMDSVDLASLTPQSSYRMKSDIKSLLDDPLPGVVVEPDEGDFTKIHILITGAVGTPYEKGFFYFYAGMPPTYPFQPPKVKFMTTSGGTVRFNPNLYANGKVCLSILGTWPGDRWSCSMGLRSLILSLQSLLNDNPYQNEPGYDEERTPGAFEKYKEMIQYDTISVAVLGNILNQTKISMPHSFVTYMSQKFLEYYDFYESTVIAKMERTGNAIIDPIYKYDKGPFRYDYILDRLESTKAMLQSKILS